MSREEPEPVIGVLVVLVLCDRIRIRIELIAGSELTSSGIYWILGTDIVVISLVRLNTSQNLVGSIFRVTLLCFKVVFVSIIGNLLILCCDST